MRVVRRLSKKFKKISPYLDEKTLRILAATESLNLPRGGISMLSKITGLSRPTIYAGIEELNEKRTKKFSDAVTRIRKSGGGRKRIEHVETTLLSEGVT